MRQISKQTWLAVSLLAVVILSGLFLFGFNYAKAANPTTINFQGKVVNSDGTNVTNGTYSFIFRIYNTASPTMTTSCTSTASCLWQETQSSVTVTNGVFQVELGSVCALTSGSCNNTTGGPINWSSTSSLYLTLQFNGDTSGANGGFMSPTIHITSAPFALQADNAATLGGLAASGFIQNGTSLQSTSNFHISGTGVADTQLQAPVFDTATSNGTLGFGTTNAGVITFGNTTNSSFLFKAKQVASAFQVQNASGNEVLTVDTSATAGNNLVRIGKPSTIDGKIVFNNSAGTNTVTIAAQASNPASSVSFFLPTAGATGTQCLQSTSGSTSTSTTFQFGSCGGGGGSLSSDYNSAGTTGNTITLTSAGGGVIIQDAATPIGATLFAVQKNAAGATFFGVTASAVTLQDSSGNNALVFDSTTSQLKIYGDTTTPTNYLSLYYDNSTSTGIVTVNSGTVQVGTGSGAITVTAGASSAVTITGHAASSLTTDSGALTLTGAAASTFSTTSGNLTIQAGSGTISTGTSTVLQKSGSAFTLDVSNGASNSTLTISNTGGAGNITLGLDTGGVFAIGASTGSTVTCGAGNYLNSQVVTGGIITGGSCSAVGGGSSTLQNAYDNSSSPAVITTSAAGKVISIAAGAAPTADLLTVTNSGFGTSTTAVDGLRVNFETAGTTNSADNAGLRIDVTSNNNGTTTTLEGLKIGDLSSAEANSTETGLYVGTGWDIGLDIQSGGLNLAGYTSGGNPSDPVAPAADNLRVYAKKVSGRMLLKFIGPSGLDSPFQPALFGNNVVLFAPSSGTTGTGTGFGTVWQSNGTVSHPTPATTAPAVSNQIKRTRYANVVTTTNQVLGPKVNAASESQFWRGNAAGLGGFFFQTRFVVDLIPASTIRIFAGLSSSTTAVVASDTVAGDVVGLWHDTTDPTSGANSFNLVTRNNTTTTKTSIALSNAIAAGNAYDFYMFCAPNGSTIYYRLDDINNGVTYEGNTATTLPRNTIFMGPQVEMSNGTANTTVTTVAIGVNRIYIESDH